MSVTAEEIMSALGIETPSEQQIEFATALVGKMTAAEQSAAEAAETVKKAQQRKAELHNQRAQSLLQKLLSAETPEALDLGDEGPHEKDPLSSLAALVKEHKQAELMTREQWNAERATFEEQQAESKKTLSAFERKYENLFNTLQAAETARAEKELYDRVVPKYFEPCGVNDDMRKFLWEQTRSRVKELGGKMIVTDDDGTPMINDGKPVEYSDMLADIRSGGEKFGLNYPSAFVPVSTDTEPQNSGTAYTSQSSADAESVFKDLYG